MQLAMAPVSTTVPLPRRDALERAFEEHRALVFRAAYRVTGNAADSEDVLQTVFLRLASRDTAAEEVDNIESYLRRAAVNASINLLDLRSRRNVSLEKAPEPHATTDQRDLREVLRMAMSKLGGRTAEMFALRFIEGFPNAEIAQMFGVSSIVVAVTLHRARRQLQKEVRALGGLL